MKVGDLVALSAYGKQRKRAKWIQRDDVGIVVYVKPWDLYPDEYTVEWQKSNWRTTPRRWVHERQNTRADLKYARV